MANNQPTADAYLWWGCYSGSVRALWSPTKPKPLQLAILPWWMDGTQSSFAESERRASVQQQRLLEGQVSDARPLPQLIAGHRGLPCYTCANCLLWKRQLLSEQSYVWLQVNPWCWDCWSPYESLSWWTKPIGVSLFFSCNKMAWLWREG